MGKKTLLVFFCCLFLITFSWARGGGGCFLGKTPITRADGSQIAISKIHPNDWVLAFKSNNGVVQKSKVQNVVTHRAFSYFRIETDKITLNVTGTHPFYIGKNHFKKVEELSIGDVIYAYDGHSLQSQILRKKILIHRKAIVYNLITDAPHTYFASGIAVHNKGGGGGGGGRGFLGGRGGFGGGNCKEGDIDCTVSSIFSFITLLAIFITFWTRRNTLGDEDLDYINPLWTRRNTLSDEDLDYINPRSNILKKSSITEKLLDFIGRTDTDFAMIALRLHTMNTFTQLQTCWGNRNYLPMKELMMPDLYQQHLQQLEGMKRNHEINRLANLKIHQIDFVNVRYTENKFNREITVLFTASLADYYVDDRNEKFLRGSKTPRPFQEFWTFQLQPSGWLLREIEQAKESDYLKEENFVEAFTDSQIEKIYQSSVDQLGMAGPALPKVVSEKENKVDRMLNFLVQSNKIWSRHDMLLRVRSAFTRVHMALESGVLDATTQSYLFPEMLVDMKARLDSWKVGGNTIEYRNFCIRKIEIVLVKSFDDKSQNEFTARISAHAQTVHLKNGKVITSDPDVVPFIELWTFGCVDAEWKLKEAAPLNKESEILATENVEEGSTPNLIKWYYTKKRG